MMTLDAIKALVHNISTALSPERVILFGSHAKGNAKDDSDIDLMFVFPQGLDKRQLRFQIRASIDPKLPVDIVVKDTEELDWRYKGWDPIVRSAIDQGITLYERDTSRRRGMA